MPEFRIKEGSLQHRFLGSRKKIQFFGGGFANGKTSGACVKALQLAMAYPGSRGLVARETKEKINKTVVPEFKKWCPKHLIKSWPKTENLCTLTNGTEIHFGFIRTQNKTDAAATSNLLSMNLDWAVIDQIEDILITHSDFLHVMGRLRGNTEYVGDDRTMPRTGPRWLIITANPTRNWVYKELIKPQKDYIERGIVGEKLMCVRDPDTRVPLLEGGRPQLLMDMFEGATYENAANLGEDYVKTLEGLYHGAMRDRYMLGLWGAFEGLVYPLFDETQHVVSHRDMYEYYRTLVLDQGKSVRWVQGYDYGLAVPSCYLVGFVDHRGNVNLVDGFYEPETPINKQIKWIQDIKRKYGIYEDTVLADPSVMRRAAGKKVVGETIDQMFMTDEKGNPSGIVMMPGNNDIKTGLQKVSGYISPKQFHMNPYTGVNPGPHLYVSDKLGFVVDEITEYMWAKDKFGNPTDMPVDDGDHAMDTIKYMLTHELDPTELSEVSNEVPPWMTWQESEGRYDERNVRHRS